MFSFERFMRVLKRYCVRPEGSICKGYRTEEVIEFCIDLIPDLKPIDVPQSRHEGRLSGKCMLGKKEIFNIDGILTLKHTTQLYKIPP
jgi:hypothetical protein